MIHNKCQCERPGYCPLMKRNMSQVRWQECKHKPHYFEMFLGEADKPRTKHQIVSQNINGVGTELKRLLKKFGIAPKGNCKCNSRMVAMNKRGISWCENNIDKITDWLQEEAKKRKMPFARIVGKKLIMLAISRAKKTKGV